MNRIETGNYSSDSGAPIDINQPQRLRMSQVVRSQLNSVFREAKLLRQRFVNTWNSHRGHRRGRRVSNSSLIDDAMGSSSSTAMNQMTSSLSPLRMTTSSTNNGASIHNYMAGSSSSDVNNFAEPSGPRSRTPAARTPKTPKNPKEPLIKKLSSAPESSTRRVPASSHTGINIEDGNITSNVTQESSGDQQRLVAKRFRVKRSKSAGNVFSGASRVDNTNPNNFQNGEGISRGAASSSSDGLNSSTNINGVRVRASSDIIKNRGSSSFETDDDNEVTTAPDVNDDFFHQCVYCLDMFEEEAEQENNLNSEENKDELCCPCVDGNEETQAESATFSVNDIVSSIEKSNAQNSSEESSELQEPVIITPCGHRFHVECLQRDIEVKLRQKAERGDELFISQILSEEQSRENNKCPIMKCPHPFCSKELSKKWAKNNGFLNNIGFLQEVKDAAMKEAEAMAEQNRRVHRRFRMQNRLILVASTVCTVVLVGSVVVIIIGVTGL